MTAPPAVSAVENRVSGTRAVRKADDRLGGYVAEPGSHALSQANPTRGFGPRAPSSRVRGGVCRGVRSVALAASDKPIVTARLLPILRLLQRGALPPRCQPHLREAALGPTCRGNESDGRHRGLSLRHLAPEPWMGPEPVARSHPSGISLRAHRPLRGRQKLSSPILGSCAGSLREPRSGFTGGAPGTRRRLAQENGVSPRTEINCLDANRQASRARPSGEHNCLAATRTRTVGPLACTTSVTMIAFTT